MHHENINNDNEAMYSLNDAYGKSSFTFEND